MDDVPYFHADPSVACNLTLANVKRRRSGAISRAWRHPVEGKGGKFGYWPAGVMDWHAIQAAKPEERKLGVRRGYSCL
jgi:hypothetical protein